MATLDTTERAVAQKPAPTPVPEILVVCVGNAYRRDDGVGLLVAEMLEENPCEGLRVLPKSGDGADLMEAWRGAEQVVVVDAAATGAEPGSIYRLQVGNQPVPSALFPYSTHAFGVAEAIEMARAMGELPPTLVIYAIEGADFGVGSGFSPEVADAARRVAKEVLVYACDHGLQRS